jgi:hypothetical protein
VGRCFWRCLNRIARSGLSRSSPSRSSELALAGGFRWLGTSRWQWQLPLPFGDTVEIGVIVVAIDDGW